MNATMPTKLTAVEKVFVFVAQPPWHALYLVPSGFSIFPVFHCLVGEGGPAWVLAFVFAGVLLALRCGVAVLRRFVPVSKEVKRVWLQRRVLAKQYDSYQWRKLSWVGLGIAVHAWLSANPQSVQIVLALACIAAGAAAAVFWHRTCESQRNGLSGGA